MSRNIRQDALQGNSQDSMNIALATAVQGHMLKGPLAIKEGISMVDRGIKRARYSVLCTISTRPFWWKADSCPTRRKPCSSPRSATRISWPPPWPPPCASTAPPWASRCAERVKPRTYRGLPLRSMNIIRIPGLADYQETLELQEQLVRAHQEDRNGRR